MRFEMRLSVKNIITEDKPLVKKRREGWYLAVLFPIEDISHGAFQKYF